MIWYASEAFNVNQFNIELDWKFTLSLQRSRALYFIVDRFQTNNTLIYSHGLLYNVAWYKHLFWFKVQFLWEATTDANYLKRIVLLAALLFPLETTRASLIALKL